MRGLSLFLALLMTALPLARAENRGDKRVVDALGVSVQLVEKPARVVTLIPSLGELAADLCETHYERIVGVSDSTDYPPALKGRSSIGPYHHFNLERVVALKPDLVLATHSGNSKDQIEHLRELGLPVVVVRTESFAEIEQSIELVGKAMGSAPAATALLERFRTGITQLKNRAGARPVANRRRVMLELGDEPLIVAGGKSFLSEALALVGATNVFGDLASAYPRPSTEELIQRDPDAILVLALGDDTAYFAKLAANWKQHPKLKAFKNGNVKILRGDEILRPSLRLLEGLARLERAIYP